MNTVLSYADPKPRARHVNQILRTLALWCGIVPASSGLAILLLFFFTEGDLWPVIGLFLLPVGGIAICLGGLVLLVSAISEIFYVKTPWRRTLRLCLAPLLVLGANPPVAMFCVYAGVFLMSRTSVSVHNVSSGVVDSFRIDGPGFHVDLGRLPPSATATRRQAISFEVSGPLRYTCRRNGRVETGIIRDPFHALSTGPPETVIIHDDKIEIGGYR